MQSSYGLGESIADPNFIIGLNFNPLSVFTSSIPPVSSWLNIALPMTINSQKLPNRCQIVAKKGVIWVHLGAFCGIYKHIGRGELTGCNRLNRSLIGGREEVTTTSFAQYSGLRGKGKDIVQAPCFQGVVKVLKTVAKFVGNACSELVGNIIPEFTAIKEVKL